MPDSEQPSWADMSEEKLQSKSILCVLPDRTVNAVGDDLPAMQLLRWDRDGEAHFDWSIDGGRTSLFADEASRKNEEAYAVVKLPALACCGMTLQQIKDFARDVFDAAVAEWKS